MSKVERLTQEQLDMCPKRVHLWGSLWEGIGQTTGWIDAKDNPRRKYEVTYVRSDIADEMLVALKEVKDCLDNDIGISWGTYAQVNEAIRKAEAKDE